MQWPQGFDMAAMMGGMGNSENLGSMRQFNFSKMQSDLFEALEKTQFLMDRHFMNFIITELNDDHDTRTLFFSTIFDKMHLSLNSIKIDKFSTAELNTEFIKLLLEYDGACE